MFSLHGRSVKRLRFGATLSLIFLICVLSTRIAISQSIVPQTNLSTTLSGLNHRIVIGVRTAAYPIGRDVKSQQAEGFCGVFGRQLKEELKKYDPQIQILYDDIENEYLKSGLDRFDGLRSGRIHIECGPNSKSIRTMNVANDIEFSDVFYITGVKLLMKSELVQEINQSQANLAEKFKQYKIGVVKDTTTLKELGNLEWLKLKHPPYETRDDALNALLSGSNEIQGYASDAPILRTLLKQGVTKGQKNQPKHLRATRCSQRSLVDT